MTRRLAAIVLIALPALAPAQTKSGFVITRGKDTVAVEMYSRDGGTLTSEIYQSNGIRTQYTMTLRPDSSVQYVEMSRQGRQGQGMTLNIAFGDTIVSASIGSADGQEKHSVPVHGKTTPFLAVSFALCEQIVQASHLAVGKSQAWTAFRLGVADTIALTVTRFHADSALLAMPDVQLKVALSPKGEVIGGRHMAQDWIVERRK